MLPAGKPEISISVSPGMQGGAENKSGPEHPKGEVRISGIKRMVSPCVVMGQVLSTENAIGERGDNKGESIGCAKKAIGCRLVGRPEFILRRMAGVQESGSPIPDVVGAYSALKGAESSALEQVEDFSVMLGFVKGLGVASKTGQEPDTSLFRGWQHPVVENLVALFDSGNLSLNSCYEVRVYARKTEDKVYLHIKNTPPATLMTPEIIDHKHNPFESDFFAPPTQYAPGYGHDDYCIELEHSGDGVFSELLKRARSTPPSEEKSKMKFLIRFRKKIPEDQVASTLANFRLVVGSVDRNQLYYSCCMPVKSGEKNKLYIEFQVPLIDCPAPNLDEIIDEYKEFKSTKDRLERNSDGSINNQKNRELLHRKSIPVARNTEQASPDKNVFTDGPLGSGIAQSVYRHGDILSVAMKFLRNPMSPIEARIVINTLKLTQNLVSRVMKDPQLRKDGEIEVVLSPIEYIAVEDEAGMSSDESVHELETPEKTESNGSTPEKQEVPRRLRNSTSESEAFNNVNLVDIPLIPEDDYPKQSSPSGAHSLVAETAMNGGGETRSHRVNGVVTVVGMQKQYKEWERVDFILKDPNEKPEVKIEIIKGIFDLIDRCDQFTRNGHGLIKCIIDGNFANFAYNRENHQLIYLDVAPATVMIDGQILPGNQFMMDWFPERQAFISKMSQDPQMSKLFVLVMLTNDLRQLEKIQSRFEIESISSDSHKEEASSLRDVVSKASSLLAEDDRFLYWCGFHFFSGAQTILERFGCKEGDYLGVVILGGLSKSFDDYIQSPWVDFDQCAGYQVHPVGSEKIKSLPLSRRMELLRLLSDVVFDHMKGIKRSLAAIPKGRVERSGLISSGITENILSDIESEQMMKMLIKGDMEHYFSAGKPNEESFFAVAFRWLKKMEDCRKCMPIGVKTIDSVNELKWQLLQGANIDAEDSNQDKVITIPCFQRMMKRVYGRRINVILVEPFYGHDRVFRTGLYQWRSTSQGQALRLEECTGVEAFLETLEISARDTMVLVNHQTDNSYLVGDVCKHSWSAIYVHNRGWPVGRLYSALQVSYQQRQDSDAKVFFEKIINGLKQLYEFRKKNSPRNSRSEQLSDEGFLSKLVRWVPESCAGFNKDRTGAESIDIKIYLSSSLMTRLKPWLRGYIDMVQDEFGKERSPRIYLIMPLPSDNSAEYARWMLRVTRDKEGHELSFMNFNGGLTMDMLQEKIKKSIREGVSSTPDFMFIEGGYGYRSGNFLLYEDPTITVCSGYNEDFLKEMDANRSADLLMESTASISYASSVGSHVSYDTDDMNSLEVEQRVYRDI
ncbi:hypothetical protein [Endozoicomonas atrinae]|uniref:hypothetical protein n=1 Tax=Endozoicomonas atrinae TaxID=1333660 RepID=UPI003B00A0B6